MAKGFRQMLKERQEKTGSLLCVGLDPLPEKTPECIKGSISSRIFFHLREIIDSTAPFACMFKPQKAHYEAFNGGRKVLQMIVNHIHNKYPDIPVFLDCKRGDIDRTQERYRIAHFEIDGVDGMNFSPYMGKDCMAKLVDKNNLGRAIVGLCYTSNPSAREVQDVVLDDGRAYWEFIAERSLAWANDLGITENAGLVMAAAYEPEKGSGKIFSEHLKKGRMIVGDNMWNLIPGVGTQRGFVEETVKAAHTSMGSIAINSSSGITTKSLETDFAEVAADEAKKLSSQMNAALVDMHSETS